MYKINILWVFLFCGFSCFSQLKVPEGYHTFLIKNCNNETRIMTFISPINAIKYFVYGSAKLSTAKTLHFSSSYKVDSNYIVNGVEKIKKSLPHNFFGMLSGYDFENKPNQDSIWFINILARVNSSGDVTIYSAYKMTFEGKDASLESVRANPLVSNIEFIFDKKDFLELKRKLKEFSSGIIH